MKKYGIKIIIAVFIVFILSVILDFQGFGGKDVTVLIPVGSSASEMASILRENKVILYTPIFKLYIRNDSAHLCAGIHSFRTSMGYKAALEELKKSVPLEDSIDVTIPEGYEFHEIASLLESKDITTAEAFRAAAEKAYEKYDFLPKDGNVEGYLFPATYALTKSMEPDEVIGKMLDAFRENILTDENIKKAEASPLELHELVTLASIIEREAALPEERAIVASVFYNRLNRDMPLESCATVQYILKERKPVLSNADTEIDSPYNTYKHYGLPPAPIASPGTESFLAALSPAETDYLFFVANGTGGHTFSETFSEHIAAAAN